MIYWNPNKFKKAIILMSLGAFMAGCEGGQFDDLKVYVTQVRSKPATPIEPMPVIETYESYIYVAEGVRDPFKKDEGPQQIESMVAVEGPGPDLDREKEDLEAYPLDTLRMVGTLAKGAELWGLVKANDGVIHRVQSGNYVGQNFGKITSIQDQQINLGEWVATTTGKWREREASLALVE